MKWVFETIRDLVKNKFTGNIRINFFEGGVTNINMDKCIKPPKEACKK